MPSVQDAIAYATEISQELKNDPSVVDVYLWKKIAEEFNNKNSIIKKIDLLLKLKIHSEDLIAINDGDNSPLSLKKEAIEKAGYEPKAIELTKNIIRKWKYPIDIWAISKNNKILHWGAIPENPNEWDELIKEAEEEAENVVKCNKNNLHKKSQKIKDDYFFFYERYLNKYLSDQPNGWYLIKYKHANLFKEHKIIKFYDQLNKKRKKTNN